LLLLRWCCCCCCCCCVGECLSLDTSSPLWVHWMFVECRLAR
jgi:hypothetical protein